MAFLRALVSDGHALILNTMRSDAALEDAIDWFERRGLPLAGANENVEQRAWTNSPKVFAHHYIDDAAVGCPLVRQPGFERECVDWRAIAALLGYDDGVFDD